jgi:hypothetical protein
MNTSIPFGGRPLTEQKHSTKNVSGAVRESLFSVLRRASRYSVPKFYAVALSFVFAVATAFAQLAPSRISNSVAPPIITAPPQPHLLNTATYPVRAMQPASPHQTSVSSYPVIRPHSTAHLGLRSGDTIEAPRQGHAAGHLPALRPTQSLSSTVAVTSHKTPPSLPWSSPKASGGSPVSPRPVIAPAYSGSPALNGRMPGSAMSGNSAGQVVKPLPNGAQTQLGFTNALFMPQNASFSGGNNGAMLPPGWNAFSNPASQNTKALGSTLVTNWSYWPLHGGWSDYYSTTWHEPNASPEREELEAQEANYIGDTSELDDDGFKSSKSNSVSDESDFSAAPISNVQPENRATTISGDLVDDKRAVTASDPDGFDDSQPVKGNDSPPTMADSTTQSDSPISEADVQTRTDNSAYSTSPATQAEATSDLNNAAAYPSPGNDGFPEERPGLEGELSGIKKGWNFVKLVQEVDKEYNDSSAETVWGRIVDVVGQHFINEGKEAVGDAIDEKVNETSPATALPYKWMSLVAGAPEIFLHPGAVWDRMKDTAQTATKASVDPAQSAAKEFLPPESTQP